MVRLVLRIAASSSTSRSNGLSLLWRGGMLCAFFRGQAVLGGAAFGLALRVMAWAFFNGLTMTISLGLLVLDFVGVMA